MPLPHPHALLVEDNSADVELFKQAIYAAETHIHLDHVPDAVGAFSYLAKQGRFKEAPKPDVILLDLTLPSIPGLEALKIMKKNVEWKDIPVIVLTGNQRDIEHALCKKLGATAVWVKPLRWEAYLDLVSIIKHCLEETEEPEECLEKNA